MDFSTIAALMKILQGSKSKRDEFSRGKNIYNGTSYAAHSGGGPQFGRPKKGQEAINKRLLNARIRNS